MTFRFSIRAVMANAPFRSRKQIEDYDAKNARLRSLLAMISSTSRGRLHVFCSPRGNLSSTSITLPVYTNLVDRFDAMIDEAILENCRKEHLVGEAMKGMTQPVTEADMLRLLMEGQSIQDTIDLRLKDVLSIAVLSQRHSKKLATLFRVLKPDEECWNKPRVNTATGQIFEQMKPQKKTIPYSVCGYADWLYSRRNSIVHGAGTAKLLQNDIGQIEALYKCKPAKTFKIKLSSIKNTATFYQSVISLLAA